MRIFNSIHHFFYYYYLFIHFSALSLSRTHWIYSADAMNYQSVNKQNIVARHFLCNGSQSLLVNIYKMRYKVSFSKSSKKIRVYATMVNAIYCDANGWEKEKKVPIFFLMFIALLCYAMIFLCCCCCRRLIPFYDLQIINWQAANYVGRFSLSLPP